MRAFIPAGETVIDMGQNMVDGLSSQIELLKVPDYIQFGEVLQDGNLQRQSAQ